MLDILLSFRSLSFSLLTFALKLSKFWYLITPLIYALEVIYFAMGVSIWFCKASMMALSSCMLLILTVLCFISSCILKSHKVAMLCRLSGSLPVGSTNRAIKSIYWLLIHVFRFFWTSCIVSMSFFEEIFPFCAYSSINFAKTYFLPSKLSYMEMR